MVKKTQELQIMVNHAIQYNTNVQVSSQEPLASSKWDFKYRLLLTQFDLCLGAENGHMTQESHIIAIVMSRMAPTSMYPVRNH